MTTKKSHRLISIDLLRTAAITGMIIYHFAFILEFFNLATINTLKGYWLILARLVQFTFLTLVGISLSLSYKYNQSSFIKKQLARTIKIFLLALIVTISTYIALPHYYIKFGILHHIATAILILIPFTPHPKTALITSLLIITITPAITQITTNFPPAYFIGFKTQNIGPALDYFPLFPWLSLSFIGVFIGSNLHTPIIKPNKFLKKLTIPGKHSLLIYMIHVPIILIGIYLYDILTS